jgi:esterase/lipase
MDIVNGLYTFISSNVAVTAIIGAVSAGFLWKSARYIYDYLKPFQEATKFAKEKAHEVGAKQRAFLQKRIKDPVLFQKIINDIDQSSEEIQDQYVLGIKGY